MEDMPDQGICIRVPGRPVREILQENKAVSNAPLEEEQLQQRQRTGVRRTLTEQRDDIHQRLKEYKWARRQDSTQGMDPPDRNPQERDLKPISREESALSRSRWRHPERPLPSEKPVHTLA